LASAPAGTDTSSTGQPPVSQPQTPQAGSTTPTTPATGTSSTPATSGGTSTPTGGTSTSGGNTPQPGDTTGTGGNTGNTGNTGGTGTGTPATADATQARLQRPLGIARDSAGNLYVADAGNFTIRKIATSGVVTTLAGSPGASGSSDGIGAAARFSVLKGLAIDAAGNLYAVDANAVRKITPAGTVTTLAGSAGVAGDVDGAGTAARFNQPWGIAVDSAGTVYVADTQNALVRRITPDGVVSVHAGTRGVRRLLGDAPTAPVFFNPMGIAGDGQGNLYITDWLGPPAPNIPEGSTFIRRIAANGAVSTVAGSLNGETGPGAFMDTFAIAADGAGNVYVAKLNSIRRVSATGTISTVAGPVAQFQSLEGITIDSAGSLYVTDNANHTVSKVSQAGEVTLVAGRAGEAGSANTP